METRSKSSAKKVNSAGGIPSAERADSAFSSPASSTTLSPAQKASPHSGKKTSPKKPRSPPKPAPPKKLAPPKKTHPPKTTSREKAVKVKKAPHKGPTSLIIATQSHRITGEMDKMLGRDPDQLVRYQADTLVLAMLEAQAKQSIYAYRDILIRAMLDSGQLEC